MPYASGDIINFAYTGRAQTVLLPPGRYKLEVWGAQGGNANASYALGGRGGFASGVLKLLRETKLFVYVGQSGPVPASVGISKPAFNGGGYGNTSSTTSTYRVSSGGGASDIRIGTDSLFSRVIVAGAGGGSGYASSSQHCNGGFGGGKTGGDGKPYSTYTCQGYGGTQTEGGKNAYNTSGNYGSFGQGGNDVTASRAGAGGGGGWYGGGASDGYFCGAGGGSSFVWTGSNAPSGYLLGPEYYLTDASTIAGNASMPSTSGRTETGHTGNGYARITVLEIYSLTPDPVGNLSASVNNGTVSLYWSASEDASGYRVSRDGVLLSDQTGLTFTETVAKNQSYVYTVIAYNDEGDSDPSSLTVYVPLVPPATPSNFRQTDKTYFAIGLAWDAASGADGYKLYKEGALLSTQTGTTYTDDGLRPNESYTYTLTAYNDDGDSGTVTLTGETKTAEFFLVAPVIHSASLSVNPAEMNQSTVLTVEVTDEFKILEPDFFYSGEIYSGEV